MLKNICPSPSVFRFYSSTLSVDILAATAGNIAASDRANEHSGNNTVSNSAARRSKSSNLTLQSRLLELERQNCMPVMKVRRTAPSEAFDPLKISNKFRRYLKDGQYTKLLIEMLVQNYLDDNHIEKIFESKELTKSEYSTFVNRLLLAKHLESNLTNVMPDTVHTEILMQIFEIYCNHVVLPEGKLTPLQSHDLNLFVKKFIDEGQLGKAQKCLDFIIKRQGIERILESMDTMSIKHFLQLRCGALPKYWRIRRTEDSSSPSKARRLGENSMVCNLSNSYRFLDQHNLLKILNFFFQKHISPPKKFTDLDSTIVYSLGYLGQLKLIDKLIKNKWLVPESDSSSRTVEKPNGELLIAVLSAYCLQNGNMVKGLETLDSFLKTYPSIHLDSIFWRRILQLSFQAWDVKKDKKGQTCHACWNIMRQWHMKRDVNLPFDHGILSQMYEVFRITRNGKGAIDVVANCFQSMFLRPSHDLNSNDFKLLQRYQKLCLKLMANKGNYHKPLQFIKEWSINDKNKVELHEFFQVCRSKYEVRQSKLKSKKQSLQRQFDEMEEEDMLLGRLW